MSEKDRRKLRIRLRPDQANDPEWIMQTLPELLLQQFRQPETAEPEFVDDEPSFDPVVDVLSNKVADQLIADAPQVIGKALRERDKVAGGTFANFASSQVTNNVSKGTCQTHDEIAAAEEARIQQMVDARIALQQTVQARLKSIGLAVEVTDKDIVRPT